MQMGARSKYTNADAEMRRSYANADKDAEKDVNVDKDAEKLCEYRCGEVMRMQIKMLRNYANHLGLIV